MGPGRSPRAGTGTVIASKDSGYTLSNTTLESATMNLALSGIVTADLTDTGSGHVFNVTGWTGDGSLTGTSETFVATETTTTTLTNTLLLAGTSHMSLSGFTPPS